MLLDNKFLMISLAGCLACNSIGHAQTAKTANDNQIAEWIEKLGSSSFVQRERARKELESIGAPALAALEKASKSSDIEIRTRALELMGRLEEQRQTQQVLAAKKIHVKLADASVEEAVAELAKASGYQIQFMGDKSALADKKITLDTGPTTFWQAVDQFCAQAGLSEKHEAAANVALPSPHIARWGGRGKRIEITAAPPPTQTPIILVRRNGEQTEKVMVSYAGAVKTQLRVKRNAHSELCVIFNVSAEPRLLNTSLVSRPDILKAVDEQQRSLSATIDKVGEKREFPYSVDFADEGIRAALYRQAELRIRETGNGTKGLKELTGKLTLRLDLANEKIARMEKVLNASGRSVAGVNGGTLKVNSIRKLGDDQFEVQVVMDSLTPNPLGANVGLVNGNVVIQGVNFRMQGLVIGVGGIQGAGLSGETRDLPELVDAKGQKFRVANVSTDGVNIFHGSFVRTATIVYQAPAHHGEPSELVLYGTRSHTIAVPFHFENVPLP